MLICCQFSKWIGKCERFTTGFCGSAQVLNSIDQALENSEVVATCQTFCLKAVTNLKNEKPPRKEFFK